MGRPAQSPDRMLQGVAARRPRRAGQETARISAAVEQFPLPLRLHLSDFARLSPRCTDLLVSFPAAAVAVATGVGPPHFRGEAMWQIRTGAPLANVSDALGVPLWMRRLPPDCFDGEFPRGACRTDPLSKEESDFGRRIVSATPDVSATRPGWLRAVFLAREFGDDDIAAWVGREIFRQRCALSFDALRLIVLFAWSSRHGDTRLRAAVSRPWTPRMSWLRAASEAARWYRRLIALCRKLDDARAEACAADWKKTHRVGRFEIRPILAAPVLRAEALAMRNCLRHYEAEVLEGRSLLFAVHADGRPIASLELTPSMDNPSRLTVTQLRGVANSAPPRGVRYAVARWMADRPAYPWRLLYEHAVEAVDRRLWSDSWRGYSAARATSEDVADRVAWVPATARSALPALQAVDSLLADACESAA